MSVRNEKSGVYIEPSNKSSDTHKCALSITLQIIGILNVLGGLILGIVLCESGGLLASIHADNVAGLIGFVISGIIGCIICFALAKCVRAADKYLNS